MSCVLVKPDAINFLLDNFFDLIPVGAMFTSATLGKHPILCGSKTNIARTGGPFHALFLQIKVPKMAFFAPTSCWSEAEINPDEPLALWARGKLQRRF